MAFEASNTKALVFEALVFEAYVERFLAPTLQPGQRS